MLFGRANQRRIGFGLEQTSSPARTNDSGEAGSESPGFNLPRIRRTMGASGLGELLWGQTTRVESESLIV